MTTDQQTVLRTLKDTGAIIAEYLEPGRPQDPAATIDRLIRVLHDQELAAAIRRMENAAR